jgi:hypothetical protein
MSMIRSAVVTVQPNTANVYNSFSLLGNERVLLECFAEEKSCVRTTKYHTALTTSRLLLRTEQPHICRCCRTEQSHTDAAIFLRDIAEIQQVNNTHCCLISWCIQSNCVKVNAIKVCGAFGTEIVRAQPEDLAKLQMGIPTVGADHKIVVYGQH